MNARCATIFTTFVASVLLLSTIGLRALFATATRSNRPFVIGVHQPAIALCWR